MEGQAHPAPTTMTSARSEVDTSRPFRSVKEAVAVFGERLLSGEAYSRRSSSSPSRAPPPPRPQYSPPSPCYSTSSSRFNQDRDEELQIILRSMKKLEAELADTKREIALLKNSGSETEMAVASLNAELCKSRAKMAEMEAAAGALTEQRELKVGSDRWEEEEIVLEKKYEYLPSLASALKLAQADGGASGRRSVKDTKKKTKKKPIVPLLGDLFPTKKDYVYSKSHCSAGN